MSEILSTDDKENKTISLMKEMKDDGYVLIGQLNADGIHDEYVKKYIKYAGTNEGLRSRARNQKAVIDGGILKNDGTAFVFAKTSDFNRTMEKMADASRIGDVIPGTDDTITEIGERIVHEEKEVLMVKVNYSSKMVCIDVETGEQVLIENVMDTLMGGAKKAVMGALETEKTIPVDKEGINRMVAVLGNPVHHEVGIFDGFLSKIREQGR